MKGFGPKAHKSIDAFNAAQVGADAESCAVLRREADAALPEAGARIWHAHPVWFLDDNPVVGYSKLKDCIRLLFWSGQSFETPGLKAQGTFKAAGLRLTSVDQIDPVALRHWLAEARDIQWDYKNIVKRKGRLERLV